LKKTNNIEGDVLLFKIPESVNVSEEKLNWLLDHCQKSLCDKRGVECWFVTDDINIKIIRKSTNEQA
jgi:hypothetical protein